MRESEMGAVGEWDDPLERFEELKGSGEVNWEYGIKGSCYPEELHRGPSTEEKMRAWHAEWVADGGRSEAFWVVKRAVTEWEVVT